MLTDASIDFEFDNNSHEGIAIGFLMGDDMVYDIAAWKTFYDLLMETDTFTDLSDQYPEWQGITVGFYKGEEHLDSLQTSEYFGSILLSDPTIIDLKMVENGENVVSPAKLIDGRLVQQTISQG
jgi:hypothetical protein